MDILISNANILTMDNDQYIENGYVGIKDGKIVYVGNTKPEGEAKEVIDGKNHLVMPGLHNIHTHIPMSAMRGYADEYDLQSWLNDKVFPVEAKHDEKTVYLSLTYCLHPCCYCRQPASRWRCCWNRRLVRTHPAQSS